MTSVPVVAASQTEAPSDRRASVLQRVWSLPRLLGRSLGWIFNFVCLSVLLGIALTVPATSVFFLGYVLLMQGRVAREGIRARLPGLATAGWFGRTAIVLGLFFLPVWGLRLAALDHQLVDPAALGEDTLSRVARGATLVWLFQSCMVIARGTGWAMVRPIANIRWLVRNLFRRDWYREGWSRCTQSIQSLHPGELASIGVRGFLGTAAWLAVPSAFVFWGPQYPLVGWIGAILLAWVTLHLPILQSLFAGEDRLLAFQSLSMSRTLRRRVPLAMLLVTLVWVVIALALRLLLIEPFAYGLLWLPGLVLAPLLLGSHVLWGWVVYRARCRSTTAPWVLRSVGWWGSFLLGLVYAGIVFLSPYLLFRGRLSLFEHPSFLFPILGF